MYTAALYATRVLSHDGRVLGDFYQVLSQAQILSLVSTWNCITYQPIRPCDEDYDVNYYCK